MNTIITIRDTDIYPNKQLITVAEWLERKTVKIILKNNKNELAFVTNPIHGFCLLPGGGIEEGENIEIAANRECQEEVGWSIRDISILGYADEWRARDSKHYTTVCVVAQVDAPIDEDLRTTQEKENGLHVVWFSFDKAFDVLKNQVAELREKEIPFYNTSFNILRDYLFLEAYSESKNKLRNTI
ncbi:MAG: NUDIX hydrolase [Candidatus Pacebacteria bacterium]|nr:NUDIX hydrolase [Candidatus Paceibacterota bacterium]MBP9851757.1 NUDIX hydrolase [Candidatus Paceibacterota bacterium]